MYFLVQIKSKTDKTYEKGTSDYATMKEARMALFTAMNSAMSKEDTQKITCVIINENGIPMKTEVFEAETPAPEETE